MSTTPPARPLRRRLVVIAASTLAVGALAAIAPTPVIETASAASSFPVSLAGQVAATGPVSVVEAGLVAPRARIAPRVVRPKVVARARVASLAPFRVGTVAYSQWWARRLMARRYGWTSSGQFQCLVTLWNHESHWNYRAHNGSSGAHGIPQALPGSKMRSAGSDWRTNPVTQILWGLSYVHGRYSTPCGALSHFRGHGWY